MKTIKQQTPKIAKEWHPTKNGPVRPSEVNYRSLEYYWWKCPKGDDHEWEAQPYYRCSDKHQTKCPFCTNRKVAKSNCLETTHPDLAEQWHPTKNGSLTPRDIVAGSQKTVWWKCPKGDDHEWAVCPDNRSRGDYGCPICSNRKVVTSNCLATTHPDLAEAWHPNKNGKLTPKDVTSGYGKKVWWQCPKGDDHEWQAIVISRTRGNNCPFCAGKKVCKSNSLAVARPDLAKEWHPTKNNITPFDVTVSSGKVVWWKCPKGDDHEWQAPPHRRTTLNSGCAVCANIRVVKSNCLATTHPILAKQWHPTKNGSLTPRDIGVNSKKRVWWKCPKGDDHEWLTDPDHRVRGRKCPFCSGRRASKDNCLSATHPKIAKEWHFQKNKNTPLQVTQGSGIKVWWKCKEFSDHEWLATPHERCRNKRATGCPWCAFAKRPKAISRQSQLVFQIVREQFSDITLESDNKNSILSQSKTFGLFDAYIKRFNVFIEYDGSYWHRNRLQLDKIKSSIALDRGFNIVRIRQTPLKRVFKYDLVVPEKFDAELYALLLITHLETIFGTKTRG